MQCAVSKPSFKVFRAALTLRAALTYCEADNAPEGFARKLVTFDGRSGPGAIKTVICGRFYSQILPSGEQLQRHLLCIGRGLALGTGPTRTCRGEAGDPIPAPVPNPGAGDSDTGRFMGRYK